MSGNPNPPPNSGRAARRPRWTVTGIASAATAVVLGHLADGTSTTRVGAGGIPLPNHAPLVIAEQFGTLESLYPGRIDLGLGRAPAATRRIQTEFRESPGKAVKNVLLGFHDAVATPPGTEKVLATSAWADTKSASYEPVPEGETRKAEAPELVIPRED